MKALPYDSRMTNVWNVTVRNSRNATFLFDRGFMDYHSARFEDCSLLFFDTHGHARGLLPAEINHESHIVTSHGGLTYGGLLLDRSVTLGQVREMLIAAASFYRKNGADRLVYKPIPYIYHDYPAEEDLYWLFRAEAELISRSVSTVIDESCPLPYSTLRLRKLKKAVASGLSIDTGRLEDYDAYWDILEKVLIERHDTFPVHSREEIKLLASRFPQYVNLYVVRCSGRIIAGCLNFVTKKVVHVQYIAADEVGRSCGALDFLFDMLREKCRRDGVRYLDFGISTERNGRYLNEGLLFQKEGLGGRSVCYDAYIVELEKLARL